MKILIITFPDNNNAIGGEDQIANSLKLEFNKLDHQVEIYHRNNIYENKDFDYDFVLSLNHPIEILSKKNIIWSTWVFNENIGNNIEQIKNNNFDIYFTNSKSLEDKLIKNKCNSFFIPFPSFDYYKRQSSLLDINFKEIDVLYLGNYNPEYKTLEKINNYLLPCINYKFKIYGGKKWLFKEQKRLYDKDIFNPKYFCETYEPYYNGIFPIEECNKISDYSKIFINFNSPSQNNLGMINNRMFDLLSNGCFIITDDSNYQKEEFGDCVEYSSGGEDLKEKINHYLANPSLIIEKQNKALNYINNRNISYEDISKEILNYINEKSNIIISKRKEIQLVFVILINDINLLSNNILSIKNQNLNNIKYKFIVNKNNRIHATKIINNNLNENYEIEIIDSNIYEYKLNFDSFSFGEIIIPVYSNIIFNNSFCNEIYNNFITNENLDIITYQLVDSMNFQKIIYGINNNRFIEQNDNCYLPYSFYCINYKNKLYKTDNIIDWNNISKDNIIKNIKNYSEIIFETENERLEFISKNNKININENKANKIEVKNTEEITGRINVSSIRFSLLSYESFEIKYKNTEKIIVKNKNIEEIIRSLQSHYTIFCIKELSIDLQNITNIILSHMNYDLFIIGDVFCIKTSLLYQCEPSESLEGYIKNISLNNDYSKIFINPKTYDIKILSNDKNYKIKKDGLKIAVVSMCGVSSYEDRYGIGGEHQVVYWLKDSFEKREDVEYCQIFDTYNYDLMNTEDYDIIFSNSCWRKINKKNPKTLSIFWHFNMDSGRAMMETVQALNYDWVWTNSYVGYEWLKKNNIKCKLKQLNASSKYHYPYQYESSLYKHDVTYIGGYQVHYKGKELIDRFIKPCCNKNFDFAIYGNRLWKPDIQKKAILTDSSFKEEYYDETFYPHYKKILPMQDFNILAKNTKIWINFNAFTQRNMQMNNDRVIWALACNAFVITDDTKEARKFYEEPDSNKCPVVFSNGYDDLLDKINYYIEHDAERTEIASRGLEFITSNKLYTDDTVDQILDLYYNEN